MTNQDGRLDRLHLIGGWHDQTSVKTDGGFEIRSGKRQLLNGRTSQAVADRRDFCLIALRLCFEDLECLKPPFLPIVHVGTDLTRHSAGIFGVIDEFSASVQIRCERHIAQFRELINASLGIVIETPEFMEDKDTRSWSVDRIVPGQVSITIDVAMFVGNLLGLYGPLHRCRHDKTSQQ